MDQYAVFGNPIAHSKSPDIHAAFAAETGQQLQYTKQCIPEDQFQAAVTAFFDNGGKGLNITLPFKLDALAVAKQLTQRAQLAGAVNTLALTANGDILGDNTDGAGLVADITGEQGWPVRAKRVLVLGAGGAVRGALQPLLECEPALLMIANRTLAKAEQLVDVFATVAPSATRLQASTYADLAGQQFDLVINGTSASLAGDVPPLPDTLLAPDAACYDMMYGASDTVFIQWAKNHGCKHYADGLGMLVGQAAQAFKLWRGVTPTVQPVIQRIRAQLSGA